MNFKIVTNSYHRGLPLVERSLSHSLALQNQVNEIIFIDQNDAPLHLDETIRKSERLTHLHYKVKCVSVARNKILEFIDNDTWLIFCDDDGYIDAEYITRLKNILQQHPELKVLAGSIIRDDTLDYYTPRHKMGGSLKNFRHTKLLMGSNFVCHSSVFKKFNGFDETFGAGSGWGSGEETDFAWKCYFSNIPMEYFPELKVYHIKPYAGSLNDSIQKARRYGIGKGALVAKWLFNNKKYIVIFELLEMTAVPILQILKSVLTLQFRNSQIYINALYGRYLGMFRFLTSK